MDGEVRQEVAKQLVKGYLVHMLVYIVVVLAFLGIAYRWCGSQVWYPWDELYPLVKSCGFKSKAGNIVEACRIITQKYGGEVPRTMEELTSLPGVGRKTANVVLTNAFGVPAIAVDTHVFRVSNRLGLADAKTVEETEQQLMKNIPMADWRDAHHWLIYHGRRVCKAQHPLCEVCTLRNMCKAQKIKDRQATEGNE